MATADEYAQWIVKNADRKGTPEFDTVAAAYADAKNNAPRSPDAPKSMADQIPGSVAIQQAAPEKPETIGNRIFGAMEVPATLATGAIGGIVGPAVGIVKGLTGGKYGTAEGVREAGNTAADVAQSMTYQPRTQTGRDLVGGIGHVLDRSGAIAVAPMAGEMSALARAASPAMDAAMYAAGRAGNALRPSIQQNVASLAQKAQQFDIPLRPDMLTNNKFARIIGESLEKVPLSGAKTDARQTAFNRAVIKTIGGDAEKLTPDVFESAIQGSGQKIGDISARTPVVIDKGLSAALKDHLENAAKFETSDVQKILTNYVDEITSKAENGTISGEAFRKINSKLGTQIRGSSNGDLKHALGSLQDDLLDALQRNASPDDLPLLHEARKQYAIAKTLEPLVAKSASGDVSPAGLMGRVTSTNAGKNRMARGRGGDIGDLARIGQQFIKEPNSSNTAERGLAYGMLGGGLAVHPATAAGIYALANAYNRSGNVLSRALTKGKQ